MHTKLREFSAIRKNRPHVIESRPARIANDKHHYLGQLHLKPSKQL